MTNLFLKAARKKYRFKTEKGLLNVEQLFELTENQLHDLYLKLESGIQKSKGLLGRKGNSEIEDKLEIVKDVFGTLQEEKERASERVENSRLKEKVLDAIAEKEVDTLKGKSIKELKKMAKSL